MQVYPNKLIILEGDRLRSLSGKPHETLKQYMRRWQVKGSAEPLMSGGLVGWLNYEIGATFDRVRGPELEEETLLGELMISRVMVVHDALKQKIRMICLSEVDREEPERSYELARRELEAAIEKIRAALPSTPSIIERDDCALERPPMPKSYETMIETLKENIFAGEVFQVVPSVQFREKLTRPGFEYYRRLRQVNGSPYMYYINFGENKLCGASPEMLVRVQGRRVWTYPIAGTRPRGATPEEDARLADELLHDEKELAEHAMLVDLARNDLGRISEAGTVRVTKLRSVERFSHVMHLVSSVEGTLKSEYDALDALKATFPAGTVSGAPKLRAMELINELEPVPRGSYAGVVGYMDFAGNLDMCITLRTMRIERDRIGIIQAGGGIVADSIPLNEWNEVLNKSAAMRQVVREVERNASAD